MLKLTKCEIHTFDCECGQHIDTRGGKAASGRLSAGLRVYRERGELHVRGCG
jgi:hypothetical protein